MKTQLYEKHVSLGARIVEFSGFQMPVEYSGIKDEHNTVRNAVGIFDVSHMGEIWVRGENATEFLQVVLSNDIAKLKINKAQYNYFPNGNGGIVDDLIVYKYDNETYFLVVNAGNISKDYQWLIDNNKYSVSIENVSKDYGQIAIQGPNAEIVLSKITDVNLKKMKPFSFIHGTVAGVKDVLIATTGYTGAGGFELYFSVGESEIIWDALLENGAAEGIKPIGLGARDTLRLEMGYNLYGNEITDETSPIEAGLLWVTKFEGKENMIDYKFLKKEVENGVSQKLVGFKMIDRGIPRHDYEICTQNGNLIGKVTSGSISPLTNESIGIGYVKTGYSKTGSEIFIKIRKKILKAEVVKMPFI